MLPQAEEVIANRIARGHHLQKLQTRGAKFDDEKVHYGIWDTANLNFIEGLDFDIINKDLVDYFHDCVD